MALLYEDNQITFQIDISNCEEVEELFIPEINDEAILWWRKKEIERFVIDTIDNGPEEYVTIEYTVQFSDP